MMLNRVPSTQENAQSSNNSVPKSSFQLYILISHLYYIIAYINISQMQ